MIRDGSIDFQVMLGIFYDIRSLRWVISIP